MLTQVLPYDNRVKVNDGSVECFARPRRRLQLVPAGVRTADVAAVVGSTSASVCNWRARRTRPQPRFAAALARLRRIIRQAQAAS
jgi:hypothetical protein